jgi:hypothetical protein
MNQTTVDGLSAEQFLLFDLGSAETGSAADAALLPQLAETAPPRANARGKRRDTPRAQPSPTAPRGTHAEPRRLEIAPAPPVPETPPLLLAAVRAALFQTLFQEAVGECQALIAQQPEEQRECVTLAVEPARLGAAAQLLLDTPTVKAAVGLLALSASFQRRDGAEQATLQSAAAC